MRGKTISGVMSNMAVSSGLHITLSRVFWLFFHCVRATDMDVVYCNAALVTCINACWVIHSIKLYCMSHLPSVTYIIKGLFSQVVLIVNYIFIYTYIYTHTHRYIYMYIYTYTKFQIYKKNNILL